MILVSLKSPGPLDYRHSVLPFLVLLAELADHTWRGRSSNYIIYSMLARTGAVNGHHAILLQ